MGDFVFLFVFPELDDLKITLSIRFDFERFDISVDFIQVAFLVHFFSNKVFYCKISKCSSNET